MSIVRFLATAVGFVIGSALVFVGFWLALYYVARALR